MSLYPWRKWNKVVNGVYAFLLHGSKLGFDRGVEEASGSKTGQNIEPHVLAAYIEKDSSVPLHSHNVCQTSIVVEGKLVFRVNEREYVLTKGGGIVIPSGVKHTAYAISDTLLLEIKSRGCYEMALLKAPQTLHLPPYTVSIVNKRSLYGEWILFTLENTHVYIANSTLNLGPYLLIMGRKPAYAEGFMVAIEYQH